MEAKKRKVQEKVIKKIMCKNENEQVLMGASVGQAECFCFLMGGKSQGRGEQKSSTPHVNPPYEALSESPH